MITLDIVELLMTLVHHTYEVSIHSGLTDQSEREHCTSSECGGAMSVSNHCNADIAAMDIIEGIPVVDTRRFWAGTPCTDAEILQAERNCGDLCISVLIIKTE